MNRKNVNPVRIVVIDSGVDISHPALSGFQFHSVTEEIADLAGHGTAVCGILTKQAPFAEIYVARLFHQDLQADVDALIAILEKIEREIPCHIINMSLGVRLDDPRLYAVCKRLAAKGVVLVSAFDNAGAASFPAAYDMVIGVDASARCTKADDFVFVEGSIVSLRAKGGIQRLAWTEPRYIISQGSSFAAPYVTAYIAKLLRDGVDSLKALHAIKAVARYVYPQKEDAHGLESGAMPFSIQRAALFPYNKEAHSLVNFADLLPFSVEAIYDTKYAGQVGKLAVSLDQTRSFPIQNIDAFDGRGIDTLILGHVDELEIYIGKPIKQQLIERCLHSGINIYSFDGSGLAGYRSAFVARGLSVYYPEAKQKPADKFGKLYASAIPVIGVFGTSKQQGKFTLQLELRRRFLNDGYHLAQLGTEPSAPLFGMDAVYPFGYASAVEWEGLDAIESLNATMHQLEAAQPDVILAGCQSGTVPMLYDNIGQIPLRQMEFLLGVKPDCIILCINPQDDLDYVLRTIKAIEGLSEGTVVGLAIYPMVFKNGWAFAGGHKSEESQERLEMAQRRIETATRIPCYRMGDAPQLDALYQRCIDHFSDTCKEGNAEYAAP